MRVAAAAWRRGLAAAAAAAAAAATSGRVRGREMARGWWLWWVKVKPREQQREPHQPAHPLHHHRMRPHLPHWATCRSESESWDRAGGQEDERGPPWLGRSPRARSACPPPAPSNHMRVAMPTRMRRRAASARRGGVGDVEARGNTTHRQQGGQEEHRLPQEGESKHIAREK